MTQRIYLAGAGVIARHHANTATSLFDDVSLAVADPNPDALATFGDEFPQARLFDDTDSMLAEPVMEDDIVVVATPPFVHAELVVQGLRSERHVLCEKPLAMNRPEATTMLSVAKDHDRRLGCCNCRFLGVPATDRIRELVQEGAIGEPYHATFIDRFQRQRSGVEYQPESPWFHDRSKSGGGVLMDWGPYDFAVLNDVLRPESVTVRDAWTANPRTAADPADVPFDVEQHVSASLRYRLADDTELPVSYERAACTHGEERHIIEIEGEEGALRWEWKIGESPATVVRAVDESGEVSTEETSFVTDDGLSVMDRPLAYFTRVIRGESAPIVTDEDAVFTFECLQSIYDCASSGLSETVSPQRGE